MRISESKWISFIAPVSTRRTETQPILCLSSELSQCVVQASKQHFIIIKPPNMLVQLLNSWKFTDSLEPSNQFDADSGSVKLLTVLDLLLAARWGYRQGFLTLRKKYFSVWFQCHQWKWLSVSKENGLLWIEPCSIPHAYSEKNVSLWTSETIMRQKIQEMNCRHVPDKPALMCLWRACVNKMMAKLVW